MTDIPQDQEPSPEGGLADHPLTAQRLAKHEATLAGEGYPYRFDRSAYAGDLHERYAALEPGEETADRAIVAGRLMAMRRMGKLVFAVLQDPTGRIQLFVDKRTLGDEVFEAFGDLDIGDWVGAEGVVITTKKGEVSVRIDAYQLLGRALRPLPDKWHGLQDVETRSRRRYIDLMVNEEARRVALIRARIVSELRKQFEERGYVEVETPVLLSQATGALARPFQTHHNALEQDMYLRIATELFLKRLVVGGMERVFEVGRIFRNEGVDATHNPEFTMLESYQAFADYNDIMDMVEEMISACAEVAVGSTEITYQGRPLDLSPPFRRARMVDLVSEATGQSVAFDRPINEMRELALKHGIEADTTWGHGRIIDELFEELSWNVESALINVLADQGQSLHLLVDHRLLPLGLSLNNPILSGMAAMVTLELPTLIVRLLVHHSLGH